MPPARRRITKALTGADTGLIGFGMWCPFQSDGHWRKMTRQKSSASFQLFEPFGHSQLAAEDSSMITAW